MDPAGRTLQGAGNHLLWLLPKYLSGQPGALDGGIPPLPRRRWITWGRTGMPVCQQMAPLGGLMDVGSTDQAVTNQRRLG